jgi:hypothetical protein
MYSDIRIAIFSPDHSVIENKRQQVQKNERK